MTDVRAASEPAAAHVVERGETLWSIARDELGAPTRWTEIW
jgi:nucleoid-associated protein YgaU